MDIFSLKQSITEMSDAELQEQIQDIRKERRMTIRNDAKPKAAKAAKDVKEKVAQPIDFSQVDPAKLAFLADLFKGLMEVKK